MAPVLGDDGVDDRQPQPAARAITHIAAPLKGLADPLLVGGGNTPTESCTVSVAFCPSLLRVTEIG